MRLSLCTTAMDRLHHVRETLPANISANSTCLDLEFVLLDYSSRDALVDWVSAEMGPHLRSGRLVFARLLGEIEFRMAHAKNIAHRLASGDIVCNVDADNFTGPDFAEYVIKQFAESPGIYLRSDGPRGTSGRMAFLKKDFESLGGYDEAMNHGWGYEDGDLYQRARAWGLKEVLIPRNSSYLNVIRHDIKESTKNYREKNRRRSQAMHRAMSKENLRRGKLIANDGQKWGSGNIVKVCYEAITSADALTVVTSAAS